MQMTSPRPTSGSSSLDQAFFVVSNVAQKITDADGPIA